MRGGKKIGGGIVVCRRQEIRWLSTKNGFGEFLPILLEML
jgi:hypothetical protein